MSAGGHIGSMPDWMVRKNMQIMAETVFPHFRESDGKPTWAREDRAMPSVRSEAVARFGSPKVRPVAMLDGVGLVDTLTAHAERGASDNRNDKRNDD